jgi:hypothetical protein
VAATFAWPIRYMLTPIFGADFPDMCVQPRNLTDSPVFKIDQDIVERAKIEQQLWLDKPESFGSNDISATTAKKAKRSSSGNRRTTRRAASRTTSKAIKNDSESIQSNSPLPTPSTIHQSPTRAERSKKGRKKGNISTLKEKRSPPYAYLSPLSPERGQLQVTYSPDVSPRVSEDKTFHPSINKVYQDYSGLTKQEWRAVESILSLAHGSEKARKLMPLRSTPDHQNSVTGLGLIVPNQTKPILHLAPIRTSASEPPPRATVTLFQHYHRQSLPPILEHPSKDLGSQHTVSPSPHQSQLQQPHLKSDIAWAATQLLDLSISINPASQPLQRDIRVRCGPRASSTHSLPPASETAQQPRGVRRSASVAFRQLVVDEHEESNECQEQQEHVVPPKKRIRKCIEGLIG